MTNDLSTCPSCGAKNRLGAPQAGRTPRCGRCQDPLPWLVEASEQDFDRFAEVDVPVLVDLWAPWCGPCRRVAPILAELAEQHAGHLAVVKVNVDQNPRLSARFRVQGIPMLLFMRRGEVVDQVVGVQPKAELERRLATLR